MARAKKFNVETASHDELVAEAQSRRLPTQGKTDDEIKTSLRRSDASRRTMAARKRAAQQQQAPAAPPATTPVQPATQATPTATAPAQPAPQQPAQAAAPAPAQQPTAPAQTQATPATPAAPRRPWYDRLLSSIGLQRSNQPAQATPAASAPASVPQQPAQTQPVTPAQQPTAPATQASTPKRRPWYWLPVWIIIALLAIGPALRLGSIALNWYYNGFVRPYVGPAVEKIKIEPADVLEPTSTPFPRATRPEEKTSPTAVSSPTTVAMQANPTAVQQNVAPVTIGSVKITDPWLSAVMAVSGNSVSSLIAVLDREFPGIDRPKGEWSTHGYTVPKDSVFWTDLLSNSLPEGVQRIRTQGNWGVYIATSDVTIPAPNGGGRHVSLKAKSEPTVVPSPTAAPVSKAQPTAAPATNGCNIPDIKGKSVQDAIIAMDAWFANEGYRNGGAFNKGDVLKTGSVLWTNLGGGIPSQLEAIKAEGGYGVFRVKSDWTATSGGRSVNCNK